MKRITFSKFDIKAFKDNSRNIGTDFKSKLMEMKKKDFREAFRRLFYYIKIWLRMSKNAFLVMLSQKIVFSVFLLGKIIRFGLFFAFIYFLVKGAGGLAGYNTNQTVFFFLTFNVVDILAQFMFREVYRFRHLLVSGDFDLILVKPMSALFRVLMGGADVIDLVTIPPLIVAVFYIGRLLGPTNLEVLFYVLLLVNGLLVATAFHVAVISMGILTLEIDHTIMIYRDLTSMGRFPIEIYRQPLRGILTYIIPIGIMISLPAKALFGMVSAKGVFLSFLFGFTLLIISLKFWKVALRSYTSASS